MVINSELRFFVKTCHCLHVFRLLLGASLCRFEGFTVYQLIIINSHQSHTLIPINYNMCILSGISIISFARFISFVVIDRDQWEKVHSESQHTSFFSGSLEPTDMFCTWPWPSLQRIILGAHLPPQFVCRDAGPADLAGVKRNCLSSCTPWHGQTRRGEVLVGKQRLEYGWI